MIGEAVPEQVLVPKAQPQLIGKKQASLRIGIPRERFPQEYRVALDPQAVKLLTLNGHEVFIEHNAGWGAHYSDLDYSNAGAQIVYQPEELYKKAQIIIKIVPPTKEELHYLQPEQVLFSAIHLGSLTREFIEILLQKRIIGFGYEFFTSEDGSLPILQLMSEIAGVTAVHIGSELLTTTMGGVGLLLGSVTGVPPAKVLILGAGTVGYHACKTAVAMGAQVNIIDEQIYKLKRLENLLGNMIHTAISRPDYIEAFVKEADLVIGAAYKKGFRPPLLVTEEMVQRMKEGSVIVDVSIDQGGCIATSRPTTHREPTYIKYGVVHYCVPNIPSRVPRTASAALSNLLGPLLLKIGDYGGMKAAIAMDPYIRSAIYTYQRHVTKEIVAQLVSMECLDINLLLAGFRTY